MSKPRAPHYTKRCIICGREFLAKNAQQLVCDDPVCRLEHRKAMQRRNYQRKLQRTERDKPAPQMFVGDPWDTDRPVYVLADMSIDAHHAWAGTDPLPSGPSPVPYKPRRIRGVYVPEPRQGQASAVQEDKP